VLDTANQSTALLKDIALVGSGLEYSTGLFQMQSLANGKVLFVANDGAWKLWITDCTTEGTQPFDILPANISTTNNLSASLDELFFAPINDGNLVLITYYTTSGWKFHFTNGTVEGSCTKEFAGSWQS